MAKMFVHYKGTVEAFKTAGLETTYANSIVFIKGGDDGTGAAVFTHGCYYANVDEALGALAYFKSVSDGTNVASAVDKNGVITFSADDPASVSVKVDEKGVHFALTEDFVKAVNETIPASVTAVDGKVDAEVERATQAEADLQTAVEAKAVTIDTTSTTDGYLKSYTIKQGSTTLGVIDIPKELVVTGGEVIVADAEEGLTKGEKYLKLSIANQEAPVYIAVKDLVDVYVGSAYIEISDSNEISIKTDDLKTALGIPTIETNLANLSAIVGTQTDEGATGDNATAFGRIKNLEEVVAGLTGSEDGSVESVETQINNAINALKGDMTSATIGALEDKVEALESGTVASIGGLKGEVALFGDTTAYNQVVFSTDGQTIKGTIEKLQTNKIILEGEVASDDTVFTSRISGAPANFDNVLGMLQGNDNYLKSQIATLDGAVVKKVNNYEPNENGEVTILVNAGLTGDVWTDTISGNTINGTVQDLLNNDFYVLEQAKGSVKSVNGVTPTDGAVTIDGGDIMANYDNDVKTVNEIFGTISNELAGIADYFNTKLDKTAFEWEEL